MNKTGREGMLFCMLISAAILMVLVSSCTIYRYVPADDYLYTGSRIQSMHKEKLPASLTLELLSKTYPAPNEKILLIPISLISYSMSKPPTGKGLNYYLHEKLGAPPVLLSQANRGDMCRRMVAQLHDQGYLNAVVQDSVLYHKRKANIYFRISTGKQYTFDTLVFPSDSSQLSRAIVASSASTLIKKGLPFTLGNIKNERERIDLELRNRGFFYFNPDFLILAADTNHMNRVYARFFAKPGVTDIARKKYNIRNFTIYSNYSSDRDSILHTLPFRQEAGFKHIDTLPRFKPILFSDNILMKEGDLYNYQNQKTTIQRMVNLNNFKFINTSFSLADSTVSPSLDASLYLTPYNRRSMQTEIGAYTKSNNFVGTEIKLRLTNRNLLHTGDHADINFSAGFEQLFQSKEEYSNRNFEGSINFYTPHFYLPFNIKRNKSEYIPRNKISVGAEYLLKPKLYTMRTLNFSYGYLWRSGENWDHAFDPLVLSLVNPTNITAAYDSTLAEDPNLAKSFEKQFIIGGEYTLNYSNRNTSHSMFTLSNSFSVNLSGNLISLIIPNSTTTDSQQSFMGIPYSQYVMASNDIRLYAKLGTKSQWVNRMFLGYGYSYTNSEVMPYIKQFFIGGSNSLRAFRNGTLGPGTYSDSTITSQAVQAGEVKFEYNSELRFTLLKYLSPAIFADAGNVWYRNEQPGMPGSGFTTNWFRELAVDAGIGLRIDASIIVFRLDVAMPLRVPSRPAGQQWVIDNINMGSKAWRQENIVLNIAFGYPF